MKRLNNLALRVIFIYIVYSLLNDLLILTLARKGVSVFIPLSIFTVLEYSLFALFFYYLSDSKSFKSFILVISILFYGFTVVSFFFLGRSAEFDSIPAAIESFLIIVYCIYYFYHQVNRPQVTFIYSTFHFWITIGIFIYVAGTFFLFVQFTVMSESEIESFWIINLISNILKNILFSIAFIIPSKPSDPNKKLEEPYDKVFRVS